MDYEWGTLITIPLVIFPFASSGNSSLVSAYSLAFFGPILVLLMVYFLLLQIHSRKIRRVEVSNREA